MLCFRIRHTLFAPIVQKGNFSAIKKCLCSLYVPFFHQRKKGTKERRLKPRFQNFLGAIGALYRDGFFPR